MDSDEPKKVFHKHSKDSAQADWLGVGLEAGIGA